MLENNILVCLMSASWCRWMCDVLKWCLYFPGILEYFCQCDGNSHHCWFTVNWGYIYFWIKMLAIHKNIKDFVHCGIFGVLSGWSEDYLRQYPSSGVFYPPFQKQQNRQGKGKQLRHKPAAISSAHVLLLVARPQVWHAAKSPVCTVCLLFFRLLLETAWAISFSIIWNFYRSLDVLILGSWSSFTPDCCWNS